MARCSALIRKESPPQCGAKTGLDLLKKQCIIFNMKKTPSDTPVHQHILRRVAKQGRGWAFTPHDFADLGDPRGIGMALTRLVRDGKIRRVARGLYDCPHPHPVLGQTGATADAVVDAVARGRHLRLLPSPQVAANQLGLSTQVPAQMIYQTDGAPSKVLLGQRQIVFRRNTGRHLSLAGRASGLVAQALRDVGNGKVTPDTIQHLRQRLDAAAKKQLVADIALVPAWMRPIFLQITRDDG
jgi:hypothetical protein